MVLWTNAKSDYLQKLCWYGYLLDSDKPTATKFINNYDINLS